MAWTKAQRERAKKDGLALVTIAVDGRTLMEGKFGGMEFTGPVPREEAQMVRKFLCDFLRRSAEWLRELKKEDDDDGPD